MVNDRRSVTVLGLGAVGRSVARRLSDGVIPGLSLHSVAASTPESAARSCSDFASLPGIVHLGDVADYGDVVVECLPPALFLTAARPVLASGKTLVAVSVGALLRHPELVDGSRAVGGRILIPSGALGGLDAVRALAEVLPEHVELSTEKPAQAFEQSRYLADMGIDLASLTERTCLYSGPADQGVVHFPKNVNVVAALALAGIGAEQTRLNLWAVPDLLVNRHTVRVRSRSGTLDVCLENLPDPDNPRTSAITSSSVIACLRNAFGTISFA